jgi:uncharacterized membrane protein YeiB
MGLDLPPMRPASHGPFNESVMTTSHGSIALTARALAPDLVVLRLGSTRGWVVEAVAAVGQRSMTCYLAQSVIWTLVFTPFLLDLSDELDVATTAALAVATWLATVVMAEQMRRADHRGPFELLTRRVTYAGW